MIKLFFAKLRSVVLVFWIKAFMCCRPLRSEASSAAEFGRNAATARNDLRQVIVSLWLSPSALADLGAKIGLKKDKQLIISQCNTSYQAAITLSKAIFASPPKKTRIAEMGISDLFATSSRSPVATYISPCLARNGGKFTAEDINIPGFRVAVILAYATTPARSKSTSSHAKRVWNNLLKLLAIYTSLGAVMNGHEAWKAKDSSAFSIFAATGFATIDYGTTPLQLIVGGGRDIFFGPSLKLNFYGRVCSTALSREIAAEDRAEGTSAIQVVCFKPGSSPRCTSTGGCSVLTSDCSLDLLAQFRIFNDQSPLADAELDKFDATSIWHETTQIYRWWSWESTTCEVLELMVKSSEKRENILTRFRGRVQDTATVGGIWVVAVLGISLVLWACGERPEPSDADEGDTPYTHFFTKRSTMEAGANVSKEVISHAFQDSAHVNAAHDDSGGAFVSRVSSWMHRILAAKGTSIMTTIINVAFKQLNEPGNEIEAILSVHKFFPKYKSDPSDQVSKRSFLKLSNIPKGHWYYLDAVRTALGIIHLTATCIQDDDTSLAEVIDAGLEEARWYGAAEAGVSIVKLHDALKHIATASLAACADTSIVQMSTEKHLAHITRATMTAATMGLDKAQSHASKLESARRSAGRQYLDALRFAAGGHSKSG